MKITSVGVLPAFSIIFIIIVFPMFFLNNVKLSNKDFTQEAIFQYDTALRTAVHDAGVALVFQEEKDVASRYESSKRFQVNKEYALNAFYKTLFFNFGIHEDPLAQDVLKRYLPAIAVIDYDGFWVYGEEEFSNAAGERVIEPVWKPKKPYAYTDPAGNSIFFTLDDYVYVYEADTKTWHEGLRGDLAPELAGRVQLIDDALLFDQVRRTTIVTTIEDELSHAINTHNEFARKLGIAYTFTLPEISDDEWNNTIDDVSFLAFFQGLPVGREYYNRYAFGGGRLVKAPVIHGAVRNGVKIHYRAECNFPDQVVEKFASEKDAAKEGYFPMPCDQP